MTRSAYLDELINSGHTKLQWDQANHLDLGSGVVVIVVCLNKLAMLVQNASLLYIT